MQPGARLEQHVERTLTAQVSVLGPFAHSPEMLLGNYYGTPAGPVTTPFDAIKVMPYTTALCTLYTWVTEILETVD